MSQKNIRDFQTRFEEHVLNQGSKEVQIKNFNNMAKKGGVLCDYVH